MSGILIWSFLVGSSLLVGALTGRLVRGNRALLIAAAVPWFALLAYLLFAEYALPYRGGGASMWPIAQLFAGTIMAAAGLLGAAVVQEIRRRRR